MKKLLHGKNVILRATEPMDAELIHAWENDSSIWQVSNTITPFSKYIIDKYIETAHLDIFQTKQLRLMIDALDENGYRTVGSIDLFNYEPIHQRAGVGILIHNKDDRNKGYATEAIEVLKKYVFEVLLLHQLFCNISADNEQSIHLFEKQGFKKVGVKKDWNRSADGWNDELMYQLVNPKK